MDEVSVFLEALKKPSPGERAAFLDQACGGDLELRRSVELLLKAHNKAGGFLADSPAPAGVTVDQPVAERPGTVIGPYKLLEEIGEGGMGTVWMAQQTEPVKRLVAIKLIKAGMDSRQVVARFEAERQALALMDHPNIAKVLDAGTTGAGRPYFVMDLVKGVPITRYCDEHHLTPRQRLELFLPVCQAVQHAHQKGVIHRDLKPSNVLVAHYDGKPVPKVIDFGVAKAAGQALTDKTLVTGFGNIVGTLEYMSPEQAEVNQLDIDTRTDIYSLGVVLYELLAGSPPFSRKGLERAGLLEMLRVIREQEPSKPSTKLSTAEGLPTLAANRGTEPAKLTKLVRGELDWIVMKALEKDRNRRYETANGFAADVQRYLADEPVLACPPSVGYRLRKFARRNKAAFATAGLVLFFIVLLGAVVGWAVRDRAAREHEIAQEEARKLDLTEQGIRQALDRAAAGRAELHRLLTKPGGVQEMLNQPARWELFLKTAQGEVAQARRLAARAEGSLDAEWTRAMDTLGQQLTNDQADYDLARRLEKIRLDFATMVHGRFNYRKSADEYEEAFAMFGVLKDDPAAVAVRLGAFPIKEQLLAGLDDWASLAFHIPQRSKAQQLLALTRQLAPDPVWGDRLRQVEAWEDKEALAKLGAQVPAARLSRNLLSWIGALLVKMKSPLAESWLRQAQAANPADFWLNYDLGNALVHTSPVEAAGFYRVAIAVRPGTSTAHGNLGLALRYQGKPVEAIAACRKAIELDPKGANVHNTLGLCLTDQGKVDEAVAAYRRAIELNPKLADPHNNLGGRFLDQGKLDDAIAAYRKAIELDPEHPAPHTGVGNVFVVQGKYEEAITRYRKAIELDPKSSIAHFGIGTALKAQGKLDEAIVAYRKAIELDPKLAAARNMLAIVLGKAGRHAEAVREFRELLALSEKLAADHPDVAGHRDWLPKARHNVGDALTNHAWQLATSPDPKVRDPKRATEVAQEALKIKSTFDTAWNALGVAHYRRGDWKGAVAALEKAAAVNETKDPYVRSEPATLSAARFFLAMSYWQLGEKDKSRKGYQRAAEWMDKQEPENADLRRFRDEAAELLGVNEKKD